MNKIFIGPIVAISTILIGEVFLRGKTMPNIFNWLPEVQNIALSGLCYILGMALFLIIFCLVYSKFDSNKR